ncbi:hypothetical protein F7734_07500 [Scytonema sp. UIC 10036]|uniref:hypothetical protein n=1 Tax=Scytonema sp. UIC 10036 TaxID=2304196 RepID=UPI0012DAD2D5|nr:hypothetical protein [Scytonema sp. UIC 10036]MUG92309.1 hypothetical protein [Scytonema sp. UIC 10036]
MAVHGIDDGLYIATSANISNWSEFTRINQDSSPNAPALAAFDGQLQMVVRGTDNHLYVACSSNGVNWTEFTRFNSNFITTSRPALAVLQGNLYLAVRGNDRRLYYSNGLSDGTLREVNATFVSPSAPALAGFESQSVEPTAALYIGVRGTDNGLYLGLIGV